jgi:Tfp pilus assembly protein PilF
VLDVPVARRPVVALDALGFYLRKLVWPSGRGIDYGRTPAWLFASGERYWTWLVPVAVIVVTVLLRRSFKCALVAFIATCIGVLPFLGLTKFEFQNVSTVADRYFYLAMLGPALIVGCCAARWPRMMLPVAVLAIAALSLETLRQSRSWIDSDALIHRALAVNPRSRIANGVLAYRAAKSGNRAEASARYARVLDLDPTDPMTNYNVANLLLADGQFDEAAARYDTALRRDPSYAQARTNLGIALMRLNRLDEAHEQFARAVQQAPRSADAHANLGMFYLVTGGTAKRDASFARHWIWIPGTRPPPAD